MTQLARGESIDICIGMIVDLALYYYFMELHVSQLISLHFCSYVYILNITPVMP